MDYSEKYISQKDLSLTVLGNHIKVLLGKKNSRDLEWFFVKKNNLSIHFDKKNVTMDNWYIQPMVILHPF